MCQAAAVAVVGQCPSIHAIFKDKVNVLRRIRESIIDRETGVCMQPDKPVGWSNYTHFISLVEELLEINTAILGIFQVTQGIIIRGTQITLDVIP